ncbi:inter-alpha-trypsin inhibitor heavy chain H4-like [Diorhabda carinulata]|uniref:inter-alpha-trypsin inhibitor heavy chain H4-like n=1 Tax=Diorhabda carinulata TaxID=1163345 RepID=UPI0025A2F3FF|nr:inter-alpha-trypsin inhibitor heavy chain H4-like [Diorhabda carinulata]
MKNLVFIFTTFLCVACSTCVPSLVLSSNFDPATKIDDEKEIPDTIKSSDLVINEFKINANVSNRFAKTLITSKVKNPDDKAKEAVFSVVLPEKAFISEFVMEIKGQTYKAYVKEKEEAENIYNKAIERGQSAGYVALNARDSNRFTVSINVEPETKAIFLLTYEELLERKNNQYELILNIHPGQIVKDLHIQVQVNESRPLKFIRTPSLRSGNEISKNDDNLNTDAHIQKLTPSSAIVTFKPDIVQQKKFIQSLGGNEAKGLTGQFVVQYDIERNSTADEVLLEDGYFVHFFAPDDIPPLPEHVVFILDTSGSMYGTKLNQVKQAMASILSELKETDIFHLVEFNTNVYVWDIENGNKTQVNITDDYVPYEDIYKAQLPDAVLATKENIAKGKAVIEKLKDEGITNILSSIVTGLHLTKSTYKKQQDLSKHHQPIIVFLTDGDPTAGIINTEQIVNIIADLNSKEQKIPIFSLSFGNGADKYFLRKLSLNNFGFSRHIYEAADAFLQLENFYKEISSPLLSNVHFKYDTEVQQVSKKDFPIFFRGSELVSVGKYKGPFVCTVEGFGIDGLNTVSSTIETPVSPLERLWAYLTVKEKLELRETVENDTQLIQEALDLALRYSFVTDVTSLVVVKPNETSSVDTVDASVDAGDQLDNSASAVGLRFGSDDDFPINLDEDDMDVFDVLTDSSTMIEPLDIREEIPWINETLNANNGFTISGHEYELGEDVIDIPKVNCTKTPLNDTTLGQCVLLHQCFHMLLNLNTFQDYQEYFCPLENKYAGICCPI